MFRDFGRKLRKNSDNCCLTDSPNQVQIKSSRRINVCHSSRRADILDVAESTLDVGESTLDVLRRTDSIETVGETTRRRKAKRP